MLKSHPFVVLLLLFIVNITIIAGGAAPASALTTRDTDGVLFHCEKDEDCMLVQLPCGHIESVNKIFKKNTQKWYDSLHPVVDCEKTTTAIDPNDAPVCRKKICAVTKNVEVKDINPLYACETADDCAVAIGACGVKKPVNKQYLDLIQSKFDLGRPFLKCGSVDTREVKEIVCVRKQCGVLMPETEAENKTVPKKEEPTVNQ